jgi:hypothetical protein
MHAMTAFGSAFAVEYAGLMVVSKGIRCVGPSTPDALVAPIAPKGKYIGSCRPARVRS